MISLSLRRMCLRGLAGVRALQSEQRAQEYTKADLKQYESYYGLDIPDSRSLGLSTMDEGEVLFEPEVPQVTPVEESSEEWKYVERLFAKSLVPEPPKHEKYPTPSGWIPPKERSLSLPYYMRRTRFHNFPIYLEILNGGNRKMTVIRKVEGDVWALEADLRAYLESKSDQKVYTQVDEVCGKLRVRGIHLEAVAQFALDKGF